MINIGYLKTPTLLRAITFPVSGVSLRLGIVILLLIMAVFNTPAASLAQSESEVKAAFTYNFAKFVQWPAAVFPSPQAPLVIGVRPQDVLAADLEALSGKMVRGRPLKILLASRAEDFQKCHVIVLSHPADARLLRETLSKFPILTITNEEENFKNLGAVINFIIEDNKVRFEINLNAARRANLTISSQLLKLGRIVQD